MRAVLHLAVIFLGFLAGRSIAAELPVSVQHPLVVSAPEGWGMIESTPPTPEHPFHTSRMVALGDRNAMILFSVLDQDRPEFDRPAVIKTILRGDCVVFLATVEEAARIELQELPIPGGIGFRISFVDHNLIGKPVLKGQFKVITPMMISLGTTYLVKVTILCDDLAAPEFQEALAIAQSIRTKSR